MLKILDETEIYLLMKRWLKDNGWIVLGGEPPGGTNDIPLIELKDIDYTKKGSKGSKKIDVVGHKQGYFLLLELKALFSYSDIKKLNQITGETKWRAAFIRALKERSIFNDLQIQPEMESEYIATSKYYVKSVGFNYTGKTGPEDFLTFLLSDNKVKMIIGKRVKIEVKRLFQQ